MFVGWNMSDASWDAHWRSWFRWSIWHTFSGWVIKLDKKENEKSYVSQVHFALVILLLLLCHWVDRPLCCYVLLAVYRSCSSENIENMEYDRTTGGFRSKKLNETLSLGKLLCYIFTENLIWKIEDDEYQTNI